MLVWKEVIPPGLHWYFDRKAKKARVLDVTSQRVQHYHDRGKEMLAAGLSIPVPLDHQPDALPLTPEELKARQVLNNAGWVRDWRISPRGRLQAQLEVLDPEVAKKLPTTIRWTSPYVHSFTDGKNRRWDDVIGHVALTTRPRILDQAPFGDADAALSIEPYGVGEPLPEGFCLSRAGLVVKDGAKYRPAYPVAFSLLAGAPLAVEEMVAVEEKAKGPPKKKPEGERRDPPGDGDGDLEGDEDGLLDDAPEEPMVSKSGDISVYSVLKDLLGACGITLPEDTSRDNFLQNLYDAAVAQVREKSSLGDNPLLPGNKPPPPKPGARPPGAPGAPPAKPPVAQEAPPMFMSIEEIEKISDATTKSLAMAFFEERKKTSALQKNLLDRARATRTARVERLLPRLPEPTRDKLKKLSEGAAFSLGDDGVVKDDLAEMLDILEAGQKDLPDLLKVQGEAGVTAVPHPREMDGSITEEKRTEVVGRLAAAAGVK